MHVFKLFQNFWVLFYFQFAFTLLWKSLGTSAESLKYFSYPSSLKELTWELHNHTFSRNNVIKAYSDCILSSMPYIVSVQFSHLVLSDSLPPHELQHTRPPCPSPTPGVHSNSCPLSQWCHPAISSSVIPFFSCPQSLPASESFPESFPMSQLFAWGGQSTGVSALASFLPENTQDWSPLEWTGWISLHIV